MSQDQTKLQALSETLQKHQDDLQSSISARQRLDSQRAENLSVQKEFALLDKSSDSEIYRLVGPVLLKQDKAEAKSTVEGRLEFIGKEIERTEGRIRDGQRESERVRGEILGLQQKMQTAGQL